MKDQVQEIIVATQNSGKVTEIKEALTGLPYSVRTLSELGNYPEAPETGVTFVENACAKAQYYARLTGRLCLADDSGLEVDCLQGAPGVYSARYAGEHASDADNNQKLLHNLITVPQAKRTARFRCVLALADKDKILITQDGTVEGLILDVPRGDGGFGYDPLFFLPELSLTMAELSPAAKNTVSHRGQALKNLAKRLAALEA